MTRSTTQFQSSEHRPFMNNGGVDTEKGQHTLLEVFNPTGVWQYWGDLSDAKSTERELKRHGVNFRTVSSTKPTRRPGKGQTGQQQLDVKEQGDMRLDVEVGTSGGGGGVRCGRAYKWWMSELKCHSVALT